MENQALILDKTTTYAVATTILENLREINPYHKFNLEWRTEKGQNKGQYLIYISRENHLDLVDTIPFILQAEKFWDQQQEIILKNYFQQYDLPYDDKLSWQENQRQTDKLENYPVIVKAEIIVTRQADKEQIKTLTYTKEELAQDAFDILTKRGSEHSGTIKFDLFVHHATAGKICRRTMYTS